MISEILLRIKSMHNYIYMHAQIHCMHAMHMHACYMHAMHAKIACMHGYRTLPYAHACKLHCNIRMYENVVSYSF